MSEYKIMIVDDEPDILDLLEKALMIEGFHNIIKAENGHQAVKTCKEINPDIIILDVMLPDIDGYEVCKQIRQFSHCPILFLSSKNDEVDKILGLAVGGDDYVTLSLFGVIFAGSALFLIYGIWLTRQTGKIAKGIGNISRRAYNPIPEKGTFGSVYMALNKMNEEIRHSDQIKEETDRVRREWITNITHDLKTPLSPVKGYAELLADGTDVDAKTAQEYGTIILKNVDYAEKLMNDLKLTYQLESGAFPFHPQQVRLVRYLKELVIDIANDPTFSNRDIEFESESSLSELTAAIDPDLFRRAVGNLVINALVHNPLDTKVIVSVSEDRQKGICITVCDNGVGIDEAEQAELFTRYYRGTNTKEKPEGSGLGLAIAKQIVVLHGGDIAVKSKPGEGTEFSILLPVN